MSQKFFGKAAVDEYTAAFHQLDKSNCVPFNRIEQLNDIIFHY